jgi:hypothetical protein
VTERIFQALPTQTDIVALIYKIPENELCPVRKYQGANYYNTKMLVSGHPTIRGSTTAGPLE